MKRIPVLFLILLAVLALIAALMVPRALRAWNDPDRPDNVKRDLDGCAHNLDTLATALGKYFDEQKHYPNARDDGTLGDAEALHKALVPRYFAEVPRCPRAGFDTYSSTYQADKFHFEVECSKGHPGRPPGHPRTDNSQIVTR